jgi:hypothetical protein
MEKSLKNNPIQDGLLPGGPFMFAGQKAGIDLPAAAHDVAADPAGIAHL